MTERTFNGAIEKLKELINDWGKAPVYLVGGCVRDLEIGELPKDIDLCIDMPDGATIFCKDLEEKNLIKDVVVYPRFGTSKFTLSVNKKEISIECVMPRTESYMDGPRKPDQVKYTTLYEDSIRRDFCCNALYMDILSDEIIDPTGHGLEDIKNRVLRTPIRGKDTFIDDPLRMLRAFRFEAEKEFKILPEVLDDIRPYPEYEKLSMERVNSEFTRILVSKDPIKTIRKLHEKGLLKYIIPELEEAWGFNQNSHYHSMNLTDHTFAVLQYVIDTSNKKDKLVLGLAALLHDIAKYKCWKKKEDGSFSYHGHDLASSIMAESILKRLKYSGDVINNVCFLIKHHMIIKPLYDRVTDSYTGKDSTTRKVVRLAQDHLKQLMILIDADNRAHSPKYNMPGQVSSFWKAFDNLSVIPIVKVCPVNGKTIMSEFNLQEGPVIKEIKNIMIEWLDEAPDLEPEDLIKRFKSEYGEDNCFWGWRNNDIKGYFINISNHKYQNSSLVYNHHVVNQHYILDETERIVPKLSEEPSLFRALDYPDLYRRLKRYIQTRNIFYDAMCELVRLYDFQGFKGVSIVVDEYHDVTGCIEWDDEKPNYIL